MKLNLRTWEKRPFLLIPILLILMLAACGGGGETKNDSEVADTEDNSPTAVPEPTVEPTPTADERLDRGIALLEEGAYAEAVTELEAANLQDPDNVEILANLGGGYLELDRAEESIAVLEQALAIDPEHPLALANLCTVRGLAGDPDVIELCQAALAAAPDSANVHNGLGVAYFNNDQLDLAAEQFLASIEIDPNSANPQNNLGLVYANQGKDDLAVEQYQKALAIDPDYEIAYANLGLLYLNSGDYQQSVENYTSAIELNPNQPGSFRNRGSAYYNLGDVDLALENYEEAARLDPTDIQSVNNLGYINLDLGQQEEGIGYLQTALEIDPTRVYYLLDIALAQTDLGQTEEAIASFTTYLEAAPDADNRAAVEAEIARLTSSNYIEQALANEGETDFTNPASVLLAVFRAAATADYATLPQLCDPQGENDGDTALICEVTAEHELAGDFESFFAKGEIVGDVVIDGEFAEIPFIFGPDNSQEETMRLILRDGQWYLYEF
ncbi:MAG: tetratricopeptide repeat protein [Anaerolineales bacterium]|nr:tetratricopeptide repeat protein [Anaerolineales bacterium]